MTVVAEKTGFWKSGYEVSVDGRQVATFDSHTWRGGGTFTLHDGQKFEVKARTMGGRYELTRVLASDGAVSGPLAVADRVGRKDWTITDARGRAMRFRRTSMWSSEQELLGPDGTPVGEIRRLSAWRGGAVAELPGLDAPLQVFVVAVVICMWDSQAAAAAGGAAAAGAVAASS
ncbi:hypothetical protein [Pseudonocardia sp. N23]|uniref:hypothetical protein n=1 Tax=Pseudonocardia sp. N23 TaxID=1987376 RepID=UPI000BFC60A2|nr:hypothetical protein [Pseudonocardia sp. N23]